MEMQHVGVARKKALLLLLAQREAQRLGVSVNDNDVEQVIASFRLNNWLFTQESLDRWRACVGLDLKRFRALMRECAIVAKLEALYSQEISAVEHEQLRIEETRHFTLTDLPTMARASAQSEWLQLNVALSRNDGDAIPAALALFDRIRQLLPGWRTHGMVTCFFFVRKPPDARLRFFCPQHKSQLADELEEALTHLQEQGLIQRFFRSCYEPEQARFGGPEAMRLVHNYFDADTSQWLVLQQMGAQKRRSFPASTLLTSVFNDLFASTLPDPAEVWDVWCQCFESSTAARPAAGDYLDFRFPPIEALRALASAEEMSVLNAYESANIALAAGLKQLWCEGKLQRGVRGILATVAMFGFNRHGIEQNAQSGLCAAIRRGFAAPAAG